MEKFLFLLVLLYFAPTMVAACRAHPNAWAILALNVFLGWTCLGWVIALVWALTNQPDAIARAIREDG